ncbi:unnamed protein product [Blumeria hordei]|uniref:Brl1/Brr6 domain-containing protein n=1 Tax=Blumeria hordei TaxID=2867405 RepID=A0A383UR26_BLUHO|nr:unnamed protein product [Blumeria hordei]
MHNPYMFTFELSLHNKLQDLSCVCFMNTHNMFLHNQTQKRSHESPMDFEWQTHAPTDPKSPFPQSKSGHKGFDFKSNNSFINPSAPPLPKFRNPSFTTPRKTFEPELYSETSGIESSPGEQGDLDDTPDQQKFSSIVPAFKGTGTIKQPIFGKYGTDFLGTSPSRVEQRRGKFGNTIIQKMRKRKRMERDYSLLRVSESDSEGDFKPKKKDKNPKIHAPLLQPGLIASFFSYIESHPNLPNVLSFYAQLIVNVVIAGLMIFGMYTFWTTVRSDVDKASEHERSLALAEISKCAQDFVINGCSSKNRAPVMEVPCNEFELCMNRNPNSVGRARISAHTFAQIFNSFIEPISYKAMIFIVLIITATVLVNNIAFGLYRSKSHNQSSFQSNSFAPQPHLYSDPSTQGFQQWIHQTPGQKLGYDIYSGQAYKSMETSHIPPRQRSASRGRSERVLSRSPSKRDRERGRSSKEREMELYHPVNDE